MSSVDSPAKTLPRILITNDDGIGAKGLRFLLSCVTDMGRVRVVAPDSHRSGQSGAITSGMPLALQPVAPVLGAECYSCNGTPVDCVKLSLHVFPEWRPDIILSGINHGSNATTASCYSGTLGAAAEAALNGVPAIGVSLETLDPDADFSAVEKYFPGIFRMLTDNPPAKKGIYYNINFPDIPAGKIKGIRAAHQGNGRWVKEFIPWNPGIYSRYGITPEMLGQSSTPSAEEGEILYMMAGEYEDDPGNIHGADHWFTRDGYISIVAHNIDTTDYGEVSRLKRLGLDTDFPMTDASSQ